MGRSREADQGLKEALARDAGPGAARLLFNLPIQNDYETNARDRLIDVAPAGRFAMIERPTIFGYSGNLVILQNFFEELKRLVPN